MERQKTRIDNMAKQLIPSKNDPDKDRIYTPDPLALAIVEHFQPKGTVLDPCSGGGAFLRAFDNFSGANNVSPYGLELDNGQNFLEDDITAYKVPSHVNWLITNFPWSKFRPFLKRGMVVADNIVSLSTINHILALRARLRDIKEAGFFIREVRYCETPKSWSQSGFQVGAILLTKEPGPCIIDDL